MKTICIKCGKILKRKRKTKMCNSCWKIGKIPSNKTRMKLSIALKNNLPATIFKKGELINEKNSKWKGDNAGLTSIHEWVKSRLGKPNKCDICGINSIKKYHWSNKNHKYSRKLSDWQMLCPKCHHKYDVENNNKKWKTRRYFKKICIFCNKRFYRHLSLIIKGGGKFCSPNCHYSYKKYV